MTSVTRRLQPLLWPKGEPALRWRVLSVFGLLAAGKLFAIATPLAYKQIIEAMSVSVLVAPVMLILAYGLSQAAVEATGALRQLIFASVSQRAIRLTTLDVFKHLQRLSLRFHLDRQIGGLSRVIQRGAFGMESLLDLTLFILLPTALELVLVSAILWRFYSAEFALVTIVAALAFLVFTVFSAHWQKRFRREMNRCDMLASARATDGLLNYETVKYFGAEAREVEDLDRAKLLYQRAALKNESVQFLLTLGQTLIIGAGTLTVMMMAGRGVADKSLTVGDFVLVNAYLLQLYAPLAVLGSAYANVKQSLIDVEAMDALLAEPVEVDDRPGATALAVPRGRIVFDSVTFGYDPRRPLLKDVSFEVPPGATVAIVGSTGAGKSTLARLLFRFYDVDGGAITIDGRDIREVTQDSLRQAVGVVPQDTVLFDETLHYNIAYGRAGASREEVEQAAGMASLHELIARLPEGYETRVGERGLKLSGGEKQRVAIARTILKNPPILIFDEATSALDSHTEAEIQASLRDVSVGRSTLVIAHRLSTIVDADEILVLDGGRIVERGRHEALLAREGAYASLWFKQRRSARAEAVQVPE